MPAFLVDGITEQRFIQEVCQGSPVRLTNLNGNSVTAEAIAKRVVSIVRLWKGRYYPIVVLVDLEKREMAPNVFEDMIAEAVRCQGITEEVIVSVVDRMIENWMICDPHVWPDEALREISDGCSGATELRRMKPDYDKAADGPGLLSRSRPSEIAKRSPSFKALQERLLNIHCHWLTR